MLRSPVSPTVALSYDDIIFQARNRAYGAFELRQQYRPTLTRALWLGVGFFLMGLAAPTIYTRIWPSDSIKVDQLMEEVTLTKMVEQAKEIPVPLPPVEQAPTVSTVRNLPLLVMPEVDVVEENLPPTTDQLQHATSGTETAEGTGDIEAIVAPESSGQTVREKVLDIEAKTEDVFIAVEQQPEFPGGMDALRAFLSTNLKYPKAATSGGVSGRVFISFVVNTDGSLTDLQVLKGIGFGCDEEAIRVMQKMPNWRPGKQSGRAVRVKYNLPIAFTLE